MSKTWSSHYLFLLASIGSAVGLSNIWRFTYLAGANGGGAFVLVYLFSLLVMGIPILAAEMVLGRIGRKGMVGTLEVLAQRKELHPRWKIFGWVAMATVFTVLSFYCVIAGWTLDYTITSAFGLLDVTDKATAKNAFEELMSSPARMTLGQSGFIIATVVIVGLGVQKGLEQSVRWMMPLLFGILVALVIYAAVTADMARAIVYLFQPDFTRITPQVIMAAFGQAFFSLGIGVGVMLTYGAYMPERSHVLSSAVVIAFADGLASILAGLAIFPIVFQYNLSPGEGPGLIFQTLPIAFAQMPGGFLAGSLFFLLLFMAALTSSISLLESIITHLEENRSRKKIAMAAGIGLWLMGLMSVLSFNLWSDVRPVAGKNIFELLDYLCSNLIMPVCGILMAVLAGWLLKRQTIQNELGTNEVRFRLWHFLVRWIAPLALAGVFISNA